MPISFNMQNTRIENDELVVFYEFSNQEKNSQKFKKTDKITALLDWGTKRGKWFDDRELELVRLQKETEKYREEQRLEEERLIREKLLWQS